MNLDEVKYNRWVKEIERMVNMSPGRSFDELAKEMAEVDQCVSCGAYAGEGRQICPGCESKIKDDFMLNEDMMKQPTKGGWIKYMFRRRK